MKLKINIHKKIKGIKAESDFTWDDIADYMTENGYKISPNTLQNKLREGTIRFDEVQCILALFDVPIGELDK